MRYIRPTRWPRPDGGTVLLVLLVATLVAPLPAAMWGTPLPPVSGLSRGELLAAAAVAGTSYLGRAWWRAGRAGALAATVVVALVAALSAVFARIIERRASGFYTEEALFEGVAVLLGMHAAAAALDVVAHPAHVRAARHGVVRTWRRASPRAPITAAAFASLATSGAALLVAASWVLVAFNARDVALALMMAAGTCELLAIVFRLPDAARALPRWIAPAVVAAAIVVAVLVLAGWTTSPAVARTLRTAPLASGAIPGGGCGIGGIDTRAAPVVPAVARRVRRASTTAALALSLNIPAYRLDLLADSAVVASYGVAVGMRRYRTPVGAFAVHRIVWNPWWIPPKSPWARKDTVTPPGPTNPMGRVKLLIGGAYYVHGTPFEASIGSAASHGCLRMRQADAIALALRLQAAAGVGPGDSALAAILADTVSVAVDLPQPVPVEIRYAVAELRGDSLLLHPDVYGLAAGRTREAALLALLAASHDTTQVRARVLAAAVRRARRRHVAVPLDSLLLASTPNIPIIARIP
jgi:lipoprotein-anchoring transpeptidase ErfK/SrfK